MQKKILSFEVKNIFRRIPRSTRCWGTLGFSALHVLFAYTEMTAGTRFGKSRTLFFLRKTSFSSFWWRVTLVTTRRKHHGEVKWEKKIIILNYSLDYFLVDVGIVISANYSGMMALYNGVWEMPCSDLFRAPADNCLLSKEFALSVEKF